MMTLVGFLEFFGVAAVMAGALAFTLGLLRLNKDEEEK